MARQSKQVGAFDFTESLTPEEVAKILRVKIDTLAMWRRKLIANKPPFVALSRKAVLYPRAEFNAWMSRQRLVNPDD